MRLWKKVLIGVLVVASAVGALFILLVGPWPTYAASDVTKTRYYRAAVAAIDASAAKSTLDSTPAQLQAGWAVRPITPPVGTPLSGFGDRKGRPSTGVHDDVYAKALAFSDGVDTAVVVGSDMLIVPENIADAVRAEVALQAPIKADNILFNSSHTHSGPGAWAPGFAASQFSGAYDPAIVDLLTKAFVEAIVEAVRHMEPAAMGHGGVDAFQFIRNRTRNGAVDPRLHYMLVQQDDGDRCFVVRYSAHPTILGGRNMEFSGDFPGYLQRYIEEQTGAFALYLGGAVGSMGPQAPSGADGFAKAEAMGHELAKLVLQEATNTTLDKNLDIATVGAGIPVPPYQMRLNTSWRVSPFLFRMLGIDDDAWMGGVRIGTVYLVGTPCDFSGELSVEIRAWAADQGHDLWIQSFNGDYVGYITPDTYYLDLEENGRLGYETGLMSWCGPNGGSYFTHLVKHVVQALADHPAQSTSEG